MWGAFSHFYVNNALSSYDPAVPFFLCKACHLLQRLLCNNIDVREACWKENHVWPRTLNSVLIFTFKLVKIFGYTLFEGLFIRMTINMISL